MDDDLQFTPLLLYLPTKMWNAPSPIVQTKVETLSPNAWLTKFGGQNARHTLLI